nr:MAG TPA: hypothetical protein [Caudoviricetes sp.]
MKVIKFKLLTWFLWKNLFKVLNGKAINQKTSIKSYTKGTTVIRTLRSCRLIFWLAYFPHFTN